MILNLLVVLGLGAVLCLLSGARSPAYLLYFLSFVPFVTFDAVPGGLEDVSGLASDNTRIKMLVRLATAAGVLLLFARRAASFRQLARKQAWPMLFFFAWALLGLHRAQSPWVSFFRLGELLVFFLLGVLLYSQVSNRQGPRTVARWHALAPLLLVVATLYMTSVDPDLASHTSESGRLRIGHRMLNANVLAFCAVVGSLWATCELREGRERVRHVLLERALPIAVAVVCLYVLYFARSRTAMLSFAVGQVVLWLPFERRGRGKALPFLFLLGVAGLWVALEFDQVREWFLREESVEALTSATGRTDLWGALLDEQVPRHSLLGYGYLMLSETGRFTLGDTHWNNAHNTYLFALVSTGIPGFLAVVAMILVPLHNTWRRMQGAGSEDRPWWLLLFVLQGVVMWTSLTGFGYCGYPNALMLFHHALFCYAATPLPRPSRVSLPAPAGARPELTPCSASRS